MTVAAASAASSPNAALRAAALSFAKQPPPDNTNPKPTSISTHSNSTHGPYNNSPGRGSAGVDGPLLAARRSASRTNFSDSAPARPPSSSAVTHSRSSSTVAASLAAARFAKPIAQSGGEGMSSEVVPARGTVLNRRKLFQDGTASSNGITPTGSQSIDAGRPRSSTGLDNERVDATSLEDISSLKSIFERNGSNSQIYSPKPIRTATGGNALTAAVLATQTVSPTGSHVSTRRSSPVRGRSNERPSSRGSTARRADIGKMEISGKLVLPPPAPHPRSRPSISRESSADTRSSALTAATIAAAASSPSQIDKAPPKPPAPRRKPIPRRSEDLDSVYEARGSTPTKAEASSRFTNLPSSSVVSLPALPLRKSEPSLLPGKFSTSPAPPLPKRPSVSSITPRPVSPAKTAAILSAASASTPHLPLKSSLTGDSIRAASLAPSRTVTPGPRKQPPAPPPARGQRRRSLPEVPKTTLKETLRKPRARSRSPSRHSPGKLLAKNHRHRHAEASRHRWRNHITEQERKRYEGLWAANRGILLPAHRHDWVVNIVVRDIWSRSRLSKILLAEIWSLVDVKEPKGMLDREEFCVGLWLIDQALRGRKPPSRVDEDIWACVRKVGVRVIVDPKRRKAYH